MIESNIPTEWVLLKAYCRENVQENADLALLRLDEETRAFLVRTAGALGRLGRKEAGFSHAVYGMDPACWIDVEGEREEPLDEWTDEDEEDYRDTLRELSDKLESGTWCYVLLEDHEQEGDNLPAPEFEIDAALMMDKRGMFWFEDSVGDHWTETVRVGDLFPKAAIPKLA